MTTHLSRPLCGRLPAIGCNSDLQLRSLGSSRPPNSFLAAAVYVSEAHNAGVLQQLEATARAARGACLANMFVDVPYNRTNFTLVGRSAPALAAAAVALARAALQLIDLRDHVANHPRVGVVDHVSCHPLPAAAAAAPTPSIASQRREAVALAQSIARQLGSGRSALPVFTYGWAHARERPLDAVRRQLGYFGGSAAGTWGRRGQPAPAADGVALPVAPCCGPAAAQPRLGVCCVGAAGWVVNYNVLLPTDDMAAARAVARAVSERGGGLPGVQAMALRHVDGIEVACNLLQPVTTPPGAVLERIGQLAAQRGLPVGLGYCTNKTPEELVQLAAEAGL